MAGWQMFVSWLSEVSICLVCWVMFLLCAKVNFKWRCEVSRRRLTKFLIQLIKHIQRLSGVINKFWVRKGTQTTLKHYWYRSCLQSSQRIKHIMISMLIHWWKYTHIIHAYMPHTCAQTHTHYIYIHAAHVYTHHTYTLHTCVCTHYRHIYTHPIHTTHTNLGTYTVSTQYSLKQNNFIIFK